jgi:hypothetical protein
VVNPRKYLVSTAEDLFINGMRDVEMIKFELCITANRHQLDLLDAEILDIIREAINNVHRGKKTHGFFGAY